MKKRGFTLIELIVTIAIISLLSIVLTSIFSLNLAQTNKAYIDEKDYKQSLNASMYIENKVRSAYKIEKIEGADNCNFYIYIVNNDRDLSVSRYNFISKDLEGEKILYARIENLNNYTDRNAKVKIGVIKDLNLYYDDLYNRVDININQNDPASSINTSINLGERLWKRDLLAYMYL